jgi:hypothetical protein
MVSEYDVVIECEPKIVTDIRHKILETFKDLIFVEEGHHYYLNGTEIPSVSNVIHQFEPEFDADAKAASHALKHGETKEYWLDKWKFNNLRATTTGTLVHEFGESLGWLKNGHEELMTDSCRPKFYKPKNWLIPTRPKEEAIIQFMEDLPSSYHLVLNEAKVYSGLNADPSKNPKNRYCGTFDMLYYFQHPTDDTKSGLVIFDYKTNADIEKTFSRSQGVFLFEPFSHMYAEPKSLYTLQLSAYQIPLEDIFPNIPILDRKLIWLKDDGTYEKITLPDMTKTLREIL